jgi:hypothetical protein
VFDLYGNGLDNGTAMLQKGLIFWLFCTMAGPAVLEYKRAKNRHENYQKILVEDSTIRTLPNSV